MENIIRQGNDDQIVEEFYSGANEFIDSAPLCDWCGVRLATYSDGDLELCDSCYESILDK
ncbi:MAG: hypothetical protein JRJ39_16330 [Deltaproteobacteria bacterium]|nr:hypothetical protein [Deltaproteobacteria bacterium]